MVAYFRPATLDEALAIRARRDVVVLAGGTDVYPARVARAGWGDMQHGDVLDISAVAGLRGIAETADHWRLGALTTWTDLIAARLPPLFDGYRRAARDVGGRELDLHGGSVEFSIRGAIQQTGSRLPTSKKPRGKRG